MSARLKLLIANYGTVFAIVLVLLALVAFGVAWQTYDDTPTHVESEEVDIEEYAVNTQTMAEVDAADAELYEQGETLVDRPVYFFNESPTLQLQVAFEPPEDADVEATAQLYIEYEATRNDQVFWDRREELFVEELDEETTLETQRDMRNVTRDIQRVQERVGTVGSVDASFVLFVDYESEEYDGSLNASAPIEFSTSAYWLDEELSDDARESRTVTHEVPGEPDMSQVGLFVLVGLVLLSLAGAIGAVLWQGIDTEKLRTDLARSEYSEWISRGEVPTRGEKEYVSIDSLEDLVDIAIDTNRRVIYDGSIDTYAVVEGDLMYFYSPNAEEVEDWLGV